MHWMARVFWGVLARLARLANGVPGHTCWFVMKVLQPRPYDQPHPDFQSRARIHSFTLIHTFTRLHVFIHSHMYTLFIRVLVI